MTLPSHRSASPGSTNPEKPWLWLRLQRLKSSHKSDWTLKGKSDRMEPPKRNTKAVCTLPSRSWHVFKGQDCKKPGRKCNWEGKYLRRGSSTLLGSSNHGRATDRMALEVQRQVEEGCTKPGAMRLALKAVWDSRSVERNHNLLGLEFPQIHQRFYSKYPKSSKLEMGTEGQMAD